MLCFISSGWKTVAKAAAAGSEAMTVIARRPFVFHMTAVKLLIYGRKWLRRTKKRLYLKKLALIVRTGPATQHTTSYPLY